MEKNLYGYFSMALVRIFLLLDAERHEILSLTLARTQTETSNTELIGTSVSLEKVLSYGFLIFHLLLHSYFKFFIPLLVHFFTILLYCQLHRSNFHSFRKRTDAHDGFWCSFLLPAALLITCLKTPTSQDNEMLLTVFTLSFGTLFIVFERKFFPSECQRPQLTVLKHSYLMLITICSTVLLFCSYRWFSALLITFATAVGFDYVYFLLLEKCPRSFTYGEAAVAAQSIVLFIISCFLTWYQQVLYGTDDVFQGISPETKFLQILISGCIFLIWIQYTVERLRSVYFFYASCILLGLVMYFAWMISLNQDPILWLFSVCTKNTNRIALMCFWIVLTAASVAFVIYQNIRQTQASTKSRKYFHLIVILIYLPGVFVDPELLYLASATILAVFIVIEIFRILEMPPLGSLIHKSFLLFLDEKDSGFLILTHTYLLIGCSCPLWLYYEKFSSNSFHISLLSGIISVGVGDTIAAIAGSRFGKHRWLRSKKTVEGTVVAIFAQLMFAVPILLFSYCYSWWGLVMLLITIVFTSILEANTSQVDNLVLPLFMYPFLCVI